MPGKPVTYTITVSNAGPSFASQAAVVDTLVSKAMDAVERTGAHALVLGGGVAANSGLRRAAEAACAEVDIHCALPSLAMCTDNAAMIAAAGWHHLSVGDVAPLSLAADPSMKLELMEAP